MIKRLTLALIFSLFVYTREAYAVFDFVATIESQLESFQKTLGKYQEIKKKAMDVYTRARRGYDAASGCIKNPRTCFAAIRTIGSSVKGIKDIAVMKNVELPEGALLEAPSEDLINKFEEGGVYKKGVKQDIQKTQEIKDENNAVLASDVATLWAKATATRQEILKEDESELYEATLTPSSTEEDEANMEKLLASQQTLSLLSARRINRMLELRSYMISAPSTYELMSHSKETTGNSGE